MKPRVLLLATLAVAALAAGCTPGQRQLGRAILSAADFACVLMTSWSDEDAVMRTCQLHEGTRDAVHEALVGKAQAARAGACRPAAAPGAPTP